LYGDTYLHLVNKAPHVVSYFYDLMDQPRRANSKRDRMRRLLQNLNLKRFIRLLQDEPWDLVINTHFLSAEILPALRRDGKLALPQATVTTDFEAHRLWLNQPCERYFTATEEASLTLQALGVPAADVVQTGIPVHPVFSEPKDRAALLAKHGLSGDRPAVLQRAGGHGVRPGEARYQALLTAEVPVEVL